MKWGISLFLISTGAHASLFFYTNISIIENEKEGLNRDLNNSALILNSSPLPGGALFNPESPVMHAIGCRARLLRDLNVEVRSIEGIRQKDWAALKEIFTHLKGSVIHLSLPTQVVLRLPLEVQEMYQETRQGGMLHLKGGVIHFPSLSAQARAFFSDHTLPPMVLEKTVLEGVRGGVLPALQGNIGVQRPEILRDLIHEFLNSDLEVAFPMTPAQIKQDMKDYPEGRGVTYKMVQEILNYRPAYEGDFLTLALLPERSCVAGYLVNRGGAGKILGFSKDLFYIALGHQMAQCEENPQSLPLDLFFKDQGGGASNVSIAADEAETSQPLWRKGWKILKKTAYLTPWIFTGCTLSGINPSLGLGVSLLAGAAIEEAREFGLKVWKASKRAFHALLKSEEEKLLERALHTGHRWMQTAFSLVQGTLVRRDYLKVVAPWHPEGQHDSESEAAQALKTFCVSTSLPFEELRDER